ncbi:unnamed protein product [Brassicogethes aeneus]|uniref:BPL/LPL catalytic domain-containing protein n=1 Tax=Brassicogethes aeneus TaxID=1431903 RepID=A0A9P0AXF9_BRAAE|nr:unnamed protein product [Brassicogethes aeneus]
MLLSLFYMYATVLQWLRLGALKTKLNGTLNSQNALLVCKEIVLCESKKPICLENLLFKNGDRVACTVVPKQKINLGQWALFPKNLDNFPIPIKIVYTVIDEPYIHIMLQAELDNYVKHNCGNIAIENFGDLIAWRTAEKFEAILKTDMKNLTKLVNCFSRNEEIDINHELQLLKIETVEIMGQAGKIKHTKKYPLENNFKTFGSPVRWQKFTEEIRDLYSKMREDNNPKIMIESGSVSSTKSDEETKKVPVSEVKPIKKESKRQEVKNTLDVTSRSRHKSKDKSTDRPKVSKEETKKETKQEHRTAVKVKEEPKVKENGVKDSKSGKLISEKEDTSKVVPKIVTEDLNSATSSAKHKETKNKTKSPEEEATPNKKDTKGKPKKQESKRDVEEKENEKSLGKKISKMLDKDKHKKEKEPKTKDKDKKERKKLKDAFKSESLSKKIDEPGTSNGNLTLTSTTNDTAKSLSDNIGNGEATLNGNVASVKPPNILVYADSLVAKENVKDVLNNMLNKDKYTVYDMPTNTSPVWNSSTVLVVVCGQVPQNLTNNLLQYLLNGGQLLCLCSDLLYSVLHTFTTAEVREHELVRFSYGQWRQVQMMHHIFCYQASPTKKQFSRESENSNPGSGNGSSPIFPRTPSSVEIQHNGKDYLIQVQVLGAEETWQTPSLMLATVKGSKGRAIFSQVHLEINPSQYEEDENKFAALKDSDQARLEIFKDILTKHFEIDCSVYAALPYTPAYFLGRHDLKLKMLSECDSIVNNKITTNNLEINFCGKNVEPEIPTNKNLPVMVHACPTNFSTVNYFETLETQSIGRLVIYSDILTSSQDVLQKTLSHGLAVIPRQQTQGKGRSNNKWISPMGAAMFSLQLHIPLATPLGKFLPITQHLVMVAVITAVQKFRGCERLNLGLKWPNDLYANGNIKIGGLVIKSALMGEMAVVNIGVGVNLSNSNPTTCINDMIKTENLTFGSDLAYISYENYFAEVFNEIERLYEVFQNGDVDYFYNLYYKYWLHNNVDITIKTKDGASRNVKVIGIDDYGYLKVRTAEGAIDIVQPDGNSFDMMKGLIAPKIF